MRKVMWIIFLIVGLPGCSGSKKADDDQVRSDTKEQVVDIHDARHSLDYQGTYTGTTPGDDFTVVNLTIILTDHEYTLRVTPLTEGAETVVQKGEYTWDRDGTIITLKGVEGIPDRYFVGENHLRRLDEDGVQHEENQAAGYILRKQWDS